MQRATLVIGLALVWPIAWFGRGQLVHLAAIGSASVLVAVPCAAFGGILLAIAQRRSRAARMGRLLCALALLIGVQVISLPVGAYLRRSDIRAARTFCDTIAHALEGEAKAAGAYPATLGNRLAAEDRVPHLLRDQDIYVSDGRSFVLSFTERDALVPRTHLYSSDSKVWTTF